MYELIVIMPAICREELHNICLPNIINILNNYEKFDKIYFVINIDNVIPNDNKQIETQNNFIELFKNTKIKLEFILSEKPCFFSAIKNLSIHIQKYIKNNSIIFLLEDDWIIKDEFNLDILLDNFEQKSYILMKIQEKNPNLSLKKKKIVSKREKSLQYPYNLSPTFWGSEIFQNVFKYIIQSEIIYDPEMLLKEKVKEIPKNLFIYKKIKIFSDIGREWMKKNKYQKWNKFTNDSKITYSIIEK